MFRFLVTASLAVAVMLLVYASGAYAAGVCGPRQVLFKAILDKFHETPSFTGVAGPDVAVIITISPEGTWSLIATHEDQACVVAAGEKWTPAPAVIPLPQSQQLMPGLQRNGLLLIGVQ